jgi:hypothetical protein
LKIQKELLYVGKKGTYLDINIWINDKANDYGTDVSIQQQTKQGDPVIYIGDGKSWLLKKEPEPKPANKEGVSQKGTDVESQIRNGDFEDNPKNEDDLPFN